MTTKFLKPNDPRLREVAQEVSEAELNSPRVQKIIEIMLKIIKGEQKGYKRGVGLAAPQIGVLKRIILVDIAAKGKRPGGDLRIYINPKITWQSKKQKEWYEGCYSTGRICGIVSRPTSIKIRAFNITPRTCPNRATGCDILKSPGGNSNPPPRWNFVEEKWTGYVARIFQHEIDHLDGKLFMDHVSDPDKLHWVEENEFPLYRNKQAWKNWPKKAPWYLIQLVKT